MAEYVNKTHIGIVHCEECKHYTKVNPLSTRHYEYCKKYGMGTLYDDNFNSNTFFCADGGAIDHMPTIDIVHCYECKYYQVERPKTLNEYTYCKKYEIGNLYNNSFNDKTFFCADGERRTDG